MSVAAFIDRIVAPIGRVNEWVGVAGRNFAGAVIAAMTVVIMVQVVSRYVFNSPISWSEELSKSLMVWATFLVAPWALRHGANVSIDMFSEALPFRLNAAISLLLTALTMWIVFVLLGESLALVERGMTSRAPTLPILTGYIYAIVPVSFAAMLGVGAEMFLRRLSELLDGKLSPDAPDRQPVHDF